MNNLKIDTEDFIASLAPAAKEAMKLTGIPASFTIAQAALESAWGTSRSVIAGNNFFGVKADAGWHGATFELPTTEYVKGKPVKVMAKWRAYESIEECLVDHNNFFVQNTRYAKALAALPCSGELFAQLIWEAGYATDPQYPHKVHAVIASHNLAQFDS